LFKYLITALLAVSVAGCGQTPLTRTLGDAFGWTTDVDSLNLNPNYAYLRVSTPERALLMVLGYEDTLPDGPVQTWYSQAGQVLQLRDGRLHATKGFPVDWTSVRYQDLPSWDGATRRPRTRFIRYRDEMPGYRIGVFDAVTLRTIAPPADARLSGIDPSQLRWLEETTDTALKGMPSARYGLSERDGRLSVVYGEQCLSAQFCMAWQTWPVKP